MDAKRNTSSSNQDTTMAGHELLTHNDASLSDDSLSLDFHSGFKDFSICLDKINNALVDRATTERVWNAAVRGIVTSLKCSDHQRKIYLEDALSRAAATPEIEIFWQSKSARHQHQILVSSLKTKCDLAGMLVEELDADGNFPEEKEDEPNPSLLEEQQKLLLESKHRHGYMAASQSSKDSMPNLDKHQQDGEFNLDDVTITGPLEPERNSHGRYLRSIYDNFDDDDEENEDK